MKFDPANALLLIAAWPDMQARPEIVQWAYAVGIRRIKAYCIPDVVSAYNRAIRDGALASPHDHFVFFDKDVAPQDMTGFLELDRDVVGATCPIENMASWRNPLTFHAGVWRCHRKVLQAIQPPWFMPKYSPDGTRKLRCGCLGLRDKILAAGFSIGRAGVCDHTIKSVLC